MWSIGVVMTREQYRWFNQLQQCLSNMPEDVELLITPCFGSGSQIDVIEQLPSFEGQKMTQKLTGIYLSKVSVNDFKDE